MLRQYKTEGAIDFNESWGYVHQSFSASDTGVVCHWDDVTGMEMPTCEKATCTGHRADDLLPFENLYDGQSGKYSNAEFYELIG